MDLSQVRLIDGDNEILMMDTKLLVHTVKIYLFNTNAVNNVRYFISLCILNFNVIVFMVCQIISCYAK